MHRSALQPRHAVQHAPLRPPTRLLTRRPALSGIPDPELPPYGLLSTPVYSLSSQGAGDGGRCTMNMITYASPIALRPQRKYALGLYVQSLSYQNVKETGRAVLQILQQQHAGLFTLLGKTSGRDVDKVAELQRLGRGVRQEYGLPVLSDATGIMELRVVSDFIPAGDHEVVICDVVAWKFMNGGSSSSGSGSGDAAAQPSGSPSVGSPLYTGYLREQGYL